MIEDDGSFATRLIAWQRVHGRHDLPWQQLGGDRDPYRVWLAEIMLQQTQVAAVIPYYRRFLDRFPDVRSLAAAGLDEVMQAWSGLGYYTRARNLHAAATRVVTVHDGVFPCTVEALAALPGIGRSTAGAIAAFACGRKAAILDGNVKRVLARHFAVDGVIGTSPVERRLWTLAGVLLPDADIERYTQGLMDLGATVCTPRSPACLLCPLERTCVAHREGREASLPQRAVRKVPPRRTTTLLMITRGDSVLLERRPPAGIWGGLWSLPEGEFDGAASDRHGQPTSIEREPGFVHGFTHFVLEADVVRVRIEPVALSGLQSPDDPIRWVAFDALPTLGLPTPIRTLLGRLPD